MCSRSNSSSDRVAQQPGRRDDHHERAVHVGGVGEPISAEREHAEANDDDRGRVGEGGEDGGPVVPEGSRGRRRPEREPGGDEGQTERRGVGQVVPGGRHKAGRMGEHPASGLGHDKDQIDDESQHQPARSRH